MKDNFVRALSTSALISVMLCGLVSGAHAEPPQIPEPESAVYRIAIHCGLGVLQLWQNAELVKEYPVEVGKGGLGKRKSGDHKTPLGDYKVSWMASKGSEKGHRIVDGTSWCKDNQFAYGPTGPRLEKLWTNAYGGPHATVISLNYPNAKDTQRGYTGDCIHIHADRALKRGALKHSYGCIHMFPKHAMELYELVAPGTPVKILP